MNLKKLTLLLAALCLATPALGWSNKPNAPKIKVGGTMKSQSQFNKEFYKALVKAAPNYDIDLDLKFSNGFQSIQNDLVDKFLEDKAHVLLINQVDIKDAVNTIHVARLKKTPIIFYETEIPDQEIRSWDQIWYIGSSNQNAGLIQGHLITDEFYVHENFDRNKDRRLQYLVLKGKDGDLNAELRTAYCKQAFADEKLRTEQVGVLHCDWNRSKAKKELAKFVESYGICFDVIIANDDEMALGAVDYLKEQGYNRIKDIDGDKYIPVAGINGTLDALKAIKEGSLLATAYNDAPRQAQIALRAAAALAHGEKVVNSQSLKELVEKPHVLIIPYAKVTRFNVDFYLGN